MDNDSKRPALRVIHLLGGHRAFDLGGEQVRIGPDFPRRFLEIPTRPYAETFRALQSIGLRPIGVEFLTRATQIGADAPDFQTFDIRAGYTAMTGRHEWSQVQNIETQRSSQILDVSSRFSTYYRLLTYRVLGLSEAYRSTLIGQLTDFDGSYRIPEDGTLFSNGFRTALEAAIHAFLADAACLRDLIAEAIWKLVLREPSTDVTTLRTFIKRTKQRKDDHPIVRQVHEAAEEDGWLFTLTSLRNAVIHIAPMGNAHELSECQVRFQALQGGSIPTIHYPLLSSNGRVRPSQDPVDFYDDEIREVRLADYDAFVKSSMDALEYLCGCHFRLVRMATDVRVAAQLDHKMLELTDKDIIGPVRIARI